MNGFERRRFQKMVQIREAAFQLFSQLGVHKVNVQEIANKANVSQVTIYNYFGSKDELVYEVLCEYLENQLQVFQKIIESNSPFMVKLEKLIEYKLIQTKQLSTEFLEEILSDPNLSGIFQVYSQKHSLPLIHKFFIDGKESGSISPQISLETIFFVIDALSNQARKHPSFFSSEQERDNKTKELINFFFYGVVGKKEDEES